MKIVATILVILFGVALYALLTAASRADDHAETLRDSEEEK
jgi:hypothetical protein